MQTGDHESEVTEEEVVSHAGTWSKVKVPCAIAQCNMLLFGLLVAVVGTRCTWTRSRNTALLHRKHCTGRTVFFFYE